MGVFDIKENIEKDFTVGDFYTLDIANLGMSGSIEEEAKKMFKVSLDDMRRELKNTPLKKFERLFIHSLEKWIYINGDGFQFDWIGMWRLKRFLKKWVKREYRSGYNKPYCESNIRYQGDNRPTRYIYIYNGEAIEYATGANMMFMFRPK